MGSVRPTWKWISTRRPEGDNQVANHRSSLEDRFDDSFQASMVVLVPLWQRAGWKSSIGFPEGSSSGISDPPGPETMSLRKCNFALRSRAASAHINDDAVPATWLGSAPVRHGLRSAPWSERRAKHQLQVAFRNHREIGTSLLLDLETEILRVKLNCWIEFVNHMSHYISHYRARGRWLNLTCKPLLRRSRR